MPEITFHVLPIVVSAVFSMILGSMWYMPKMFGNTWMQLVGIDMERAKQGRGMSYALMFLGSLIVSWILSNVVAWAGATTFVNGLVVGFWMWLGFIATVTFSDMLFAKRPGKLFLITNGYQLIFMLVAGGIVTVLK